MAYRSGDGGSSRASSPPGAPPCPPSFVRPFYRHFAIALSLFVIVGFSRTYYLRFLSDLPPLETLVHLHGLVFSAWLLVFIAQTRLVAARRVDLHMKLGIAAMVLAVVIVVVSFATTRSRPPFRACTRLV
jgi:hypothetical protein